MLAAIAGLIAGWVHVFSGPDHIAAVAPISVDKRNTGWVTGLTWGIGHTIGVMLIGVTLLLFRDLLPLDLLGEWLERLVGIVLVLIGLWGLHRLAHLRMHAHEHDHNGERHRHYHFHRHGEAHNDLGAHRHGHALLLVGLFHGLAGGSHFFAILPALALPSMTAAIAYLVGYGVGTITAMLLFTMLLGLLARRSVAGGLRTYQGLLGSCCALALVIGIYWLVG